ncbi:MAG: RNA-binding protein [Candidatus Methylarchaceae archaeon HK01B]|nr:RNA-binding protein [Candidatus Methylarchaceae archaeon HK01B]
MNFEQIEESLSEISRELDEVEGNREKLLRESRDVISLSAKAITDIHSMDLKNASSKIDKAKELLEELRKFGTQDLHRYLIVPETEYVEASALYSIAMKKPIPSDKELEVTNVSYLLGLLDTIGEIKRRIYDEIRRGKSSEASELFTIMEQLYILLLPFAVYDRLAQGLRRKLDVARILIEDTRSAVTEEARRSKLIKSIEKLSKRLSSNK